MQWDAREREREREMVEGRNKKEKEEEEEDCACSCAVRGACLKGRPSTRVLLPVSGHLE